MARGALHAARTALAPLASPHALSWTVIAIFAPLEFMVVVPANAAASGGAIGLWAVAFAVGLVVLVAMLLAARLYCGARGGPSLGMVLGAYFVATFVQAPVFAWAAVGLGAISDPQIIFRLTGPLIHMPLLVLVGLAVTSHAAHRRVIGELEDKRTRLLAIGPSLDTELDRLQHELADAVRASLEPALRSLDTALTHAARGGATDAALTTLDAIVEEQVRPISRDLVADTAAPITDDITVAGRAPARVPLPRRFRLARGVLPALAAVAITFAATPTTVRDLQAVQGLQFLLALLLCGWACLWAFRQAVGNRQVRTPVGVGVILILHMAVFALAMWVIAAVGIAAPRAITLAGSLLFGAIGVLIVGAMLVDERRAESESALADATERLERAVALTLRRQRLVRRRLAFVLHGSLQGALHAAALRVAEGADLDLAFVDEVRADVAVALEQLDAPRGGDEGCRVRAALDELAEVWRGARDVVADVAPDVDAVLGSDPDADEAVAEVVREAVNNAFRHGDATTVHVHVTTSAGADRTRPAAVMIVVSDDGRGHGQELTPGVGSALLDDLCASWERSPGPSGSIMRAEVAVAGGHRAHTTP